MEYKTPEIGKIYELDDRCVVMMGDYVAVCWNSDRGSEHKYIDFVNLRYDPRYNPEWYEDDDSTVSGGISSSVALQVAEELIMACGYMKGSKS